MPVQYSHISWHELIFFSPSFTYPLQMRNLCFGLCLSKIICSETKTYKEYKEMLATLHLFYGQIHFRRDTKTTQIETLFCRNPSICVNASITMKAGGQNYITLEQFRPSLFAKYKASSAFIIHCS